MTLENKLIERWDSER